MMAELLVGLAELEKRLRRLDDLAQRKALNKGVNAGGKILLAKARGNAKKHDNPKTPNKMWLNVALKRWKQRKGRKYLGLSVGVLGGSRDYSAHGEIKTGGEASENPGGDTFYWRFLEFGTSETAAKPFLFPALVETEAAATQAIAQGAIQAIKDSAK